MYQKEGWKSSPLQSSTLLGEDPLFSLTCSVAHADTNRLLLSVCVEASVGCHRDPFSLWLVLCA